MAKTEVSTREVKDGEIKRADLHTANPGESVITRLLSAFGISINSSTGGDSGTGDVEIGLAAHSHIHLKQLSGRFEIDTDNDWACWSDLNFGPSLQDWDLDLGNGATPNIDWDGLGLAFPAGAILKRMVVKVRANNDDVDSIETYVRMHDVDFQAGDPIDSNGEIGAIEVSPATTFDLDAGTKQANDMQVFIVPLGDYKVQNDGADMHVMMRAATGSLTANRQLRTTIFIEFVLPNNLENNS